MFLLLVLASCSKEPVADLQYVKQARSLAAEWALVNEQSINGKLTDIYVRSMHHWLRGDLLTAYSSLAQPHSVYGDEMRLLLAEPADAAPPRLRAHAEALKHIEDEVESA
jgi:hypothetical protein